MYRVVAKLTSDVMVNIEADRIVEDGDFIKVFDGNNLVGVFDLGSILFVYRTKAK